MWGMTPTSTALTGRFLLGTLQSPAPVFECVGLWLNSCGLKMFTREFQQKTTPPLCDRPNLVISLSCEKQGLVLVPSN